VSDNDRLDPHSGARVHIVAARQNRPNLPSSECPFCVGGLESPEPYDVKSFANRWPALETGACEVVLYSSQHDATFASLGSSGIRNVIDLWAERTTQLQQQNDVDYVLIFEIGELRLGQQSVTHMGKFTHLIMSRAVSTQYCNRSGNQTSNLRIV